MDVTSGLERFSPPRAGVVLTLGNFDGLHCGHARILAAACDVAARLGAPVAALTFHPHPLAILAPERAPALLTTLVERLALLESLGVRHTIVLRSDRELLSQHAHDFLARLVAHCRPRAIVEGPDFNFGRGRSGNLATLREHAAEWGYEVHAVPAAHCPELPTNPIISSSSIRQAIRDGRIEEANLMLGRPYRIAGTTVRGAGRGAGLGIPTANLDRVVHLLPQEAVYAAVAQVRAPGPVRPPRREDLHLAAVNVGPQPTFGSDVERIEAHLLDYAGDLRGRRIALYLVSRLREQQKFARPAELVAQVQQDIAAVRGMADRLRALVPQPL
jgi:riboflavin kinase/FMN adenylyltransferase